MIELALAVLLLLALRGLYLLHRWLTMPPAAPKHPPTGGDCAQPQGGQGQAPYPTTSAPSYGMRELELDTQGAALKEQVMREWNWEVQRRAHNRFNRKVDEWLRTDPRANHAPQLGDGIPEGIYYDIKE
jgi:hypothetical protein